MNILVINGCARKESRTWDLTETFLNQVSGKADIKTVHLEEEKLNYLTGETLGHRDALLKEGRKDDPFFRYAHEFASADIIVIAAPFWDLSLPAMVKVYIENISVDGITFGSGEQGLYGMCKAAHMVYLTTRGGIYGDNDMEIGSKYLSALCQMYGVDQFHCVSAEGLDICGLDMEQIMNDAKKDAKKVADLVLADLGES